MTTRWNQTRLAWVGAATLLVGCTKTDAEEGARSGVQNAPVAAQTTGEADAGAADRAELDLTTDAGRRAAFERLKGDYEGLRARLEGAAQDAKLLAADARRDGLRELQRLCDDLERRLDQLEDSGGEQWIKTRAQVSEHAQRLQLECERLLGEKR